MVRRSKVIEQSIKYGATGEQFIKYQENLRRKSRQRSLNGSSIRLPASNALLKISGNKWGFDSEKALEDFVYDNLNNLLGMTPLQRQYYVDSQVCDILAIDHNKQLVVIELKNSEDRYIVQQLTRYYASLLEKKAFPPEIDCYQPSRLIAITPRFHKHNLIDKEYSKLSFEFIEFQVIQENNYLYLNLINIDTKEVIKAKIPHQENDTYKLPENLPEPPKALQNILIKGTTESKNRLLEIRQRILGFHERIQEITTTGVIKYGRGKTKICAEIRFDSSLNRAFLWLYLPMTHMGRPAVGRMRIFTNDWNTIQYINYIPLGKRSGSLYRFDDFKQYINQEKAANQSNQLDILLDMALETWLNKI